MSGLRLLPRQLEAGLPGSKPGVRLEQLQQSYQQESQPSCGFPGLPAKKILLELAVRFLQTLLTSGESRLRRCGAAMSPAYMVYAALAGLTLRATA